MNIAEKRIPQDGRAGVRVGDRLIDLRIASLPSNHGERIVIRLLDKSARLYSLPELGMRDEVLRSFRDLIGLEHGLILVTGPTGGGKSTTLYAALCELDVRQLNVVTLEDPIEYQLDGVSQTQVNEKKGMTFASGLRNVLRQDPDVIMIGEIRDRETAVMAIQAALTGHLVFSTLHTNDAAGAVTRLADLGIEPYLISSSLVAVLAQRLVRRICPMCRAAYEPTGDELRRLQIVTDRLPEAFWQGNGCAACRQTGYSGRLGVFELLVVDDEVRASIQRQANASAIREAARRRGMKLLGDDGLDKIAACQTTVEEVLRISMRTLQ
jgi:general secretion pathway protein E